MRLLLFTSVATAALTCHPEGPIVPRPTSMEDSPSFQSAVKNLTASFQAAIDGALDPGFAMANASFSLSVVAHDADKPIWTYHRLSELNVNGTQELDDDSQYQIGSVSKLITDIILLKVGLDLDAPVTEYLPVLKNGDDASEAGIGRVGWDGVTLRMLSMHLAGAPMNYGFSEFYVIQDIALQLGLPPIANASYPPCGVLSFNDGCSKEDFLQGMRNVYPVTAPNERPAYSNVAFSLIAYSVEAVTGLTYEEQVQKYVAGPLGMTGTTPAPGDDAKGVIPPGETSWGTDYGFSTPGGGLVSTVHDLSLLAHSILARKLFSEPETLAWLKPTSFAGSPYTFVGQPWEIFRTQDLTPAHPHSVAVYSKAGGAYGYRAHLSLLDDYGVGIVLLTAGQQGAMPYLFDAVLAALVPAVDEAARAQAMQYAGTFSSPACTQGVNGTEEEDCLSAVVEQDGDSVRVRSLMLNSRPVDIAILWLYYLQLHAWLYALNPVLRLFPSSLVEETTLGGKKVTREVWHVWIEPTFGPGSEFPGAGTWSDRDCRSWTSGDWVHYGKEPLDRWIFVRDAESGEVVGLEVPFLREGVLDHVTVGNPETDGEAEGEGEGTPDLKEGLDVVGGGEEVLF